MTDPKCFIHVKAPKSYYYSCCCYQFIGYKRVPPHNPWGFRSLSGTSRSIPFLHNKILAKSSSVFLNNLKSLACGCSWGKSGIGVAFARTWKYTSSYQYILQVTSVTHPHSRCMAPPSHCSCCSPPGTNSPALPS